MKIIVLGGGSAGWMSASTLIKTFPDYDITVIESPNTPIIGVGESTIGGIKNWTQYLGIDDKEFLKYTDGSYKLSIRFQDFYKKDGSAFHYPFGPPTSENFTEDQINWWFKKSFFPNTPNSDYVDCFYPQMSMVNQNKFTLKHESNVYTAYHFDAVKFGMWLRENFCIPRGVKHIVENIDTIEKNDDGIVSLNGKHKADLYIDCTGFKSMLLSDALEEPFESYEDLLPNNSAWATRVQYKDKEKELVSYTNCTAIDNGWVWQIPLWSRMGTGYVYSDKYVSDEDALQEFKNFIGEGADNLEYKNIKMRVGIHRRLWVKNVVAVGLSAGFIEPLESNGLFTVHEFLIRLVRNLNKEKITQFDKDNYTYMCKILFRNFAEFVAQHYALSRRDDTPYWKDLSNKQWDDKLITLEPFILKGIAHSSVERMDNNYYNPFAGFHCIAAGMNWNPNDLSWWAYNNQIDYSKVNDYQHNFQLIFDQFERNKKKWNDSVKDLPSLYQWLKQEVYQDDF